MIRTPIEIDFDAYPLWTREFFEGAKVFDSSCSREARVIFIDKGEGYYLKRAEKGTLKAEKDITNTFTKRDWQQRF